jgi:hypothetical protein
MHVDILSTSSLQTGSSCSYTQSKETVKSTGWASACGKMRLQKRLCSNRKHELHARIASCMLHAWQTPTGHRTVTKHLLHAESDDVHSQFLQSAGDQRGSGGSAPRAACTV